MNYKDFKINLKENIEELTEAFLTVLGPEYKELIKKNLNNLLLMSFILPSHLKSYLERMNLNPLDSEDLIKDEQTRVKIKSKYYQEYLQKLIQIYPDNSIFKKEVLKTKSNPTYHSPIFKSLLNNEDSITKFIILESLGYNLIIKKPYILYKEKNDAIVDEAWKQLMSEEETKMLGIISKEMLLKMEEEITLNIGSIKENQSYFDQQDLLIARAFNYREIAGYPKARYVAPDISLKTNEVIPILVFCPLFDINEYTLLSFIHELTHAIVINYLSNGNRIKLKLGLNYLEFSRGINIYDEEECKKDKAIYNQDSYALNEAITQYIAILVTQVILDNHLCKTLFPFPLPKQKVTLEASYPNLMLSFKDFFENNFSEIKEGYCSTVFPKSFGNMDCKYLNELANQVKNNSSMIEEVQKKIAFSKRI